MEGDIPGDHGEQPAPAWLLDPLGPNEVRVHVECGEGAEVSDDVRHALETLVRELQGVEVEGFAVTCPDLTGCHSYSCDPLGRCNPQWRNPCAWDEGCKINPAVFRRR